MSSRLFHFLAALALTGGGLLARPGLAQTPERVVEGNVPWLRVDALYLVGAGELKLVSQKNMANTGRPLSRCYEDLRKLEIPCEALAQVGYVERARVTFAADAWVRRVDILEMRQ